MIEKNTIQEILDASRIEEVVGDYVTLKKRGARYLGLCPFHNEKTPSFTVTPRLGIYKCFGCSRGGDSVNFLMEHEKLSYPEALKYLAKKYNIEVQEKEKTPEQVEVEKVEESLLVVTEFASKYFSHNLFSTEQGKAIGLSYFKERGFREDIIKKFGLGYALEQSTAFTDHALRMGYNLDFLKQTGLTKESASGLYDGYKGRVIFPISNHLGRVIAFGGRTLSSDKKVAKYVNSPESPIYHKSKELYGIHLAKNSIKNNDICFLVEGYTDVISMFQAGFENVVASSGTALTTDQIRLIKRYTKNITILYDGDAAGIKAAFRGIDMILEEGMDVKIVLFPDGQDPDSFAKSHRSSEVEDFLKSNSKNFIFFKTGLLLEESQGDPMKMSTLTREIVTTISIIPDRILQAYYIKECAALLKINEDMLMSELNRIRRQKYDKKVKDVQQEGQQEPIPLPLPGITTPPQVVDTSSTIEQEEMDLINLIIKFSSDIIGFYVETDGKVEEWKYSIAKYIIDDLKRDSIELTNPLYRKILEITDQQLEMGIVPNEHFYLYNEDIDISSLAITLLSSKYVLSDWASVKINVKTVDDNLNYEAPRALIVFKRKYLSLLRDEKYERLKVGDHRDHQLVLMELNVITEKIKLLSEILNRNLLN